jgi:hypothetical protein
MPTTLPRTVITHTPPVRQALDVARACWPQEKESALIVRMMEYAAQGLAREERNRLAELSALAAAVDADYGHGYGDDYLAEVRRGW